VRIAAAVAAAGVLAAAACGGGSDRYAGLSRGEADGRVTAAARDAESDGALARQLTEALSDSPQAAMGRAGGVALGGGGPKLTGGATSLKEGETPSTGEPAWVGSFALAGIGSALTACVYVWDGGSAVDVRPSC
jgi:hypothetical protein